MRNLLTRYIHWLHTRWPAGGVEKLPEVGPDGETSVPGVRIVGDLTGIPLLKFSADTGARAVQAIVRELRGDEWKDGRMEEWKNGNDHAAQPSNLPAFQSSVLDLAIIGAGVSGISAALEAKKAGLRFQVFEAVQNFSTIANFPKGKPIYTYPTNMTPAGQLKLGANVKEALLEELESQRKAAGIEPVNQRIERIERTGNILLLHPGIGAGVEAPVSGAKPSGCDDARQAAGTAATTPVQARRVIVAIGRSGNYRKLGVPGENLDKVYNRLYDPKEYAGKQALVVGGGDSAMETAIALAVCGANVVLSYRGKEFSRPKPENIEKIRMLERDPTARTGVERPTSDRVNTAMDADNAGQHAPGSLRVIRGSNVKEIREREAVIKNADGKEITLPNDVVFVMIGREAPLDFFRRSKIAIRGEWRARTWVAFVAFLLFCVWLYHWKADYLIPFGLQQTFNQHFGLDPGRAWEGTLPHASQPVREYFTAAGTLGHTLMVSASGRSFYYTLAYCLCVLIFGIGRMKRRRTPYVKAQTITLTLIQWLPLFLLPEIILPWLGHNGGFNDGAGKWFADQFFPLANYGHGREYWRAYGFILAWPLMAWNWFTDQPLWGWLAVGFLQTFVIIPLIIRRWGKGAYCGWICSCGALAETMGDKHRQKMPHGPIWNRVNMVGQVFLLFAVALMFLRILGWAGVGWATNLFYLGSKHLPLVSYAWFVDLLWAGILGVGLYFWFSGRVWCRFACPLAALMHIYARFSRFRIFPEKSKCISCNVCTSVCHQGIDIMNFANKGMAMEDPQCVRCSACVQECPTGVLAFGRFGGDGQPILDRIAASPVRMREQPGGK